MKFHAKFPAEQQEVASQGGELRKSPPLHAGVLWLILSLSLPLPHPLLPPNLSSSLQDAGHSQVPQDSGLCLLMSLPVA